MKKKALILGASSDIGKLVVDEFITNGYKVYAQFNTLKPNKVSKNIEYIHCDLSDNKSYSELLKKIEKIYFNSFVNLVGFIDSKILQSTNYYNLKNSLKINFIYPILISNVVSKLMVKNKFGRILHCSSIGVKFGGGENTYSYSLSKHCLEFIPQYYKKVSKFNLLYNVLRIGVTETKIHKKISYKNLKKRVKMIPQKRPAKPKEIADYIHYLSSNHNSFISNQILSISGGE